MRAVLDDGDWTTRKVTTGEAMETHKARELMRGIAEGTWVCGDPGMQFDTTVNEWHTCPNTDRINASNPCSEYMFLDDSACNLASINLMKFVRDDGEFDVTGFKAACRTLITAQEIIVPNSSYPTKAIEKNSHEYRPLGLGYANLGALLMSRGLPYDSDEGRAYAAAITAVMTGEAYAQSARVARDHGGPFSGFERNREPFMRVMRKHRDAVSEINQKYLPVDLYAGAKQAWDEAVELGEDFGYRNAQATVLAPTGTIGFMMDCDTTGVEPDIALVKYKKLVGGGLMKIVNNTVPMALSKLGYTAPEIEAIVHHIDEHETIEGAPFLKDEHLPVFDCAFKAANGERSIHYMGHIRMMGATQPFISGAISKTVNVPREATVEDIERAYVESWRLGAKAISIYRDGSKRTQPLNTSKAQVTDTRNVGGVEAGLQTRPEIREVVKEVVKIVETPRRRKLPDERQAITHKFDIAGHEGYVTVGLFDDGTPGEIFLTMAKEGSTISGFADAFAQAISYSLQYGVPLQVLVDKFSHARFEPSGMTKNPEVRFAKSIVDYIFRWMATKFLSPEAQYRAGVNMREEPAETEDEATVSAVSPKLGTSEGGRTETARSEPSPRTDAKPAAKKTSEFAAMRNQEDAPPCTTCGSIMIRSGSCYKCANCGTTSGCA
jgi:ribonucleoside-diphosphate reductase alpha chain